MKLWFYDARNSSFNEVVVFRCSSSFTMLMLGSRIESKALQQTFPSHARLLLWSLYTYRPPYSPLLPEHTRFLPPKFSEVRDGTSLCIGKKCLLYQPLYFSTDKPRLLDSLFRDPGFIFAGVDVLENMRGLHAFCPGTSIDIEELAVERWCWPKQGIYWKQGLKVLAKSVADLDISHKMPEHVRLSSLGGSKVELTSVEQIEYAAVEVYALFRIGRKMLKHGYAVPNMMKSASDDDDDE
ncbi:hypothetical protein DCAR_0520903 [Daucus carota subsp. sativus]|uniref:Uncharacterized protein n=1 Tax=Daucus carota subsp. sativus TaxID=79200 RepID=A0A164YXI2_DAUCS|nr:hypothetical protein DCAR_0520903 [Daucus carota subsp. sativus]